MLRRDLHMILNVMFEVLKKIHYTRVLTTHVVRLVKLCCTNVQVRNDPAKRECLGRIIEMRELDVLIVTEMELKGRAGKVGIWYGDGNSFNRKS